MAEIVDQEYMCDSDGNVRMSLHTFKRIMSKVSEAMKSSHELLLEIREHRNIYVTESKVDGSALLSLEKKAIVVNDITFDLLMEVDGMFTKRRLPKLSNQLLVAAPPPD